MSEAAPILIAGPTASGKSALALALAERLGGVVINADSMQVYRELHILTARPSAADEARAPHWLYGHVSASDPYSAGRYIVDAARALADARAMQLRPIFVGGTGLYFKALLEGLSPIPEVDPVVRAHWRETAERIGAAELHAMLAARDPVMSSRLRPTDPQRLVRALEVLDATGRSLSYWQAQPGQPAINAIDAIKLVVWPDRAQLHALADVRFAEMVAAGGIDEVARLASMSLDPQLPAMRAIGVAPLLAFVRGEVQLADAVARGQSETRQYIKRQETWLKSNMITWKRIAEQLLEEKIASSLAFIQS